MLTATGEPSNLTKALEDSHWCQEMHDEYNAPMENETWHLVPPIVLHTILLTADGSAMLRKMLMAL
jgi:hypothetical protein